MNRKSLLGMTLFTSLLFFIFACRKDITNFVNDRNSPSSSGVESAKIWRMQHLNRTPITLKPIWKDAWEVSSHGKTLIVVPTPENYIADKMHKVRRFFIFTIKAGGVEQGKIIELVGNNYDIEKNLDFLIENHENKQIPGFDGAILEYNINYYQRSNRIFADGNVNANEKLEFGTMNAKEANLKKNSRMSLSTLTTCPPVHESYYGFPFTYCAGAEIHFHWIKTTEDNGCISSVEYFYDYHTCPQAGSNDTGIGSGSGSGSGSGTASNGGGGYGGNTRVTFDQSVLNNPKVLCVLTRLINGGAPFLPNAEMLTLLNNSSIFNYSVVFKIGTVTNPDSKAQTSQDPNNPTNFIITFDQSKVADLSKMEVAKVTFHEAFHLNLMERAYATFGTVTVASWPTPPRQMGYIPLIDKFEGSLLNNGSLTDQHHEYMAANMEVIKNGLKSFSNAYNVEHLEFQDQHFYGLAYEGLNGSVYYNNYVIRDASGNLKTTSWLGSTFTLQQLYPNLAGTLKSQSLVTCPD